jgi:hypothetical protein
MYKIIRFYFNNGNAPKKRTIKTGLTLAEAQAHCNNPETSSSTADVANALTQACGGKWFDGYTEI